MKSVELDLNIILLNFNKFSFKKHVSFHAKYIVRMTHSGS